MVENSEEIIKSIINKKLTNCLKSLPLLHVENLEVKCLTTPNKRTFYLQTKLVINKTEYIEEKLVDKKNLDLNQYIHNLLEKIPSDKKEIRVINLMNFSRDYLKNFQEDLKVDNFILDRLPYRQLSVVTETKKFFVNLSKETYYNLKHSLQKLNKNTIDFSVLINNLKRKEILMLLILLSQS